jgi:hypothetical protein
MEASGVADPIGQTDEAEVSFREEQVEHAHFIDTVLNTRGDYAGQ